MDLRTDFALYRGPQKAMQKSFGLRPSYVFVYFFHRVQRAQGWGVKGKETRKENIVIIAY